MRRFLASKSKKLRDRLSDRLLDFQPYIRPLELEHCSIRFLYATAQAARWYDPLNEATRHELDWLVSNIAPEGATIIDAGAYHGLYTTVLALSAGPQGEVVAVDPVPSNQAVIEANLAINGLSARIEGCAISNIDGEVAFSRESCGRVVGRGGLRRPARRLRSIHPDATIVKLDIEGLEFEVVPAQLGELTEARVWIVEIHPRRGRDPELVIDAFRRRGFDLWWRQPARATFEPYRGQSWTDRTTLVAIRSA